MAMTKVRVRGLGLVSCYGSGLQAAVSALEAGREGTGPLTAFPLAYAEQLQVNQYDHHAFPPGLAGAEAMMHAAIHEALDKAGLHPGEDLTDCALVMGTNGLLFAAEAEYRLAWAQTGAASTPQLHGAGWVAPHLARAFGLGGAVLTLSTACSSSANALLVASDLLTRGEARRALVLGVEGLSAVGLNGFQSLMLLDSQGCRPFDQERAGLQLGEGAAALILEAAEEEPGRSRHPASRGTDTSLCGGANLCDIHHVTSASPDGSAMAETMTQALHQAGIRAADITAIKAHGTGSPDNDTAEAAAMRRVFGATPPPFTGIKRYLGHTLAACGAIETAVFLGCLQAGFIPATAGFRQADEALAVTPLQKPLPALPGYYLFNFFGFGGNYASLVMHYG